jgi:hypothetical protein
VFVAEDRSCENEIFSGGFFFLGWVLIWFYFALRIARALSLKIGAAGTRFGSKRDGRIEGSGEFEREGCA